MDDSFLTPALQVPLYDAPALGKAVALRSNAEKKPLDKS
jgi:hypothetical protein